MGTTAITDQFKQDLLKGAHNFASSGGLAYGLLLIKATPSGSYDKTLQNIGTPGAGTPSVTNVGTDEVSGTGYTSGGVSLTNSGVTLSTDTAVASFSANPSWTSATFTATGAVIFTNDSTKGSAGRVVSYHDFGGSQSVSAGTFTLIVPTANASTGIIRIG